MPDKDIIITILSLILLAFSYRLLYQYNDRIPAKFRNLFTGVLFAFFAILDMAYCYHSLDVVLLDGTTIILSAAAFLAGHAAAGIALISAGVFRLLLGGEAAYVKLGILATSIIFGLLFRYRIDRKLAVKMTTLSLFAFLLHLFVFIWLFLIPGLKPSEIVTNLALPILIIYPVIAAIMFRFLIEIEFFVDEEKKRQAEEEKFRIVFETANVGKSLTMPDGKVNANQALCNMLGYTRDELNHKKWQDITPAKDIPEIKRIHEPLLSGKKDSARFHKRYLHKNGSVIWGDVSTVMNRDKNGKPLFFITTITDITEQIKTKEQLEREQKRMKGILDATGAGTWEWNIQTGESVYNDRWAEMLGYTLEELSPVSIKTFAGLLHPGDHKYAQKQIEKILRNECDFFESEFRLKHKNGNWVWIRDRGKVITRNEAGEPEIMMGTHIDITPSKAAIERIERLNRIIADSQNEIYLFSTETLKFVEVNRKALQNLGYSIEEIQKLTPVDLKPEYNPDSFARLLEKLEEKEDKEIVFETVHKRKDGTTYPVEVFLQKTIFNNETYYSAIIIDITKRRKTEEDLRESRNKLRHNNFLMQYIIEHNQSAVAVYDKDLRYIFVSKRYLDDYGIADPEIIGKHMYEVLPDLPEKWKEVHRRALRGGIFNAEDDPFNRADGSIQWNRWECRPWFQADGSIGGIVIYNEIITQRKKAEEELRKNAEYLNNLFNYASAPIMTWDPAYRITRFNHAFERLTGYSTDEIIGKPVRILFPKDESAESQSKVSAALSGENWESVEIRILRKDGAIITALWNSANIYSTDRKTLIETIVQGQDITERNLALQNMNRQLIELKRWQEALLGRESRIIDLKNEVNALLIKNGEPPKYNSSDSSHGKLNK